MFDFCFFMCYTALIKGENNETIFNIWDIYVCVKAQKDDCKRDCAKL